MKIYLLRHEKRYLDSNNFDVDLTPDGFKCSKKLADILEELNIDIVYSSPYKRVIQTIEPYLIKSNKKINIEYGLYESLTNDTDESNIRKINTDLYGYNYINKYYKSFIDINYLEPGENYEEIKFRSRNFVRNLQSNDFLINKNILIVTHMSIINGILDRKEDAPYAMGDLVLFFENGYLTNSIK